MSLLPEHRMHDLKEALEKVYASEPSKMDPVLEKLQAEALRENW